MIPLIDINRSKGAQEMGETREPMASDCWSDAQRLAHMYAKKLKRDFWVLFAAKQHTQIKHGIVMGWEVIAKRPPAGMVGVMVFHWDHQKQELEVDTTLSLPYDIPLSEQELSTSDKDFTPTLVDAAKKSNSILLA